MHLISEMPMILKAVYVDGWNIAKERENYDTKDSLLREIAGQVKTGVNDFADDAEGKVKAVFRVMRRCISDGEMQHVIGQLNPEMAELLAC
jgi:uncharacterized protein (DUF2267 family)